MPLESVVDFLSKIISHGLNLSVSLDIQELVPEVLLYLDELRFPCLALFTNDIL